VLWDLSIFGFGLALLTLAISPNFVNFCTFEESVGKNLLRSIHDTDFEVLWCEIMGWNHETTFGARVILVKHKTPQFWFNDI
jgi:hypothetical protein